MATTLAQFQSRIRSRVDLVGNNVVTDTELVDWINASVGELYDLLVAAADDWYLTSSSPTVAAGASTFPLPAGVLRVRGLERDQGGGQFSPVPRGQWNERWQYISDLRYITTGQTVRLFPTTLAPGSYVFWYVPIATVLSAPGDSFDGINGWDDYVLVQGCIKCREKQRLEPGTLGTELSGLRARIDAMASHRDGNEPPRIVDVQNDFTSWPWLP